MSLFFLLDELYKHFIDSVAHSEVSPAPSPEDDQFEIEPLVSRQGQDQDRLQVTPTTQIDPAALPDVVGEPEPAKEGNKQEVPPHAAGKLT